MKTRHGKVWLLALALITTLSFGVRAATVTATLDPPDIAPGDTSQLTVTVTGSQEHVSVPNVAGLDITAVANSSQIEVINGSISVNASTTYTVTAQRPGNYTIPAIKVAGATSLPITLHVGQGNGPATASLPLPPPNVAPSPSTGPVVMPPPAVGPTPNPSTTIPQGKYGWLQITLLKRERELYVGELVPVDVKAYIRDDMQVEVRDVPQFNGDGISMNSLGTKPVQTTETVGAHSYAVLTWHTAITAAKTGDFPLQLKMPLVVTVPMQMPQMNADDFNSFFQNAFSAMGQRREVSLQNGAETLKVLPLPTENRPADFSGAVGQFEIEASATPTQVSAGDPMTLRLKVTGRGNFDRVSSNLLAADSNWKTYSPKSSFEPADSVGYEGTKTFEQPIIPNDSSVTSIPSVSFSFFNPETRTYVTRSAASIAVVVTGSTRNASASVAVNTPAPNVPQPNAAPAGPSSDLAMNKIEPGTFFATLRPIYLSPMFLAAQTLPLLALVAGMFLIRRQRHVSTPQRLRAAATQQAIRQQVVAMDEAIQNRNSGEFFISARAALQQKLGAQWNLRPETITLAEIQARLGDNRPNVRSIFELADQVSYSELHLGEADLAQWRQVVRDELAENN